MSDLTPVLLLVTDDAAVMEHAMWLDGEVVRVPTVGAARRWLAEYEQDTDGRRIAMVAWGPDVLSYAEEHMRLWSWQLVGVPQVALHVPAVWLRAFGVSEVLGKDVRIVPWPAGLEELNGEVWGASSADAA